MVDARSPHTLLWNEYMARYRELGFTPMPGSQLRYAVFAGEQWVALPSFGASAWKLAARDRHIGWADAQRLSNLQRVVNDARFLILPWVCTNGLAYETLAMAAPRLPGGGQQRYGYRPVLLQTFVQVDRHRRTRYKAAN